MGVVANNSNSPTGGAIDSEGADKALDLCSFVMPLTPILSLVDTWKYGWS